VDWIIKAANERNAATQRHQRLREDAPRIWEEVQKAINDAIVFYRKLPGPSNINVSSPGSIDEMVVAAFDEPERERESVAIKFERSIPQITARFSRDKSSSLAFPIVLNSSERAHLTGLPGSPGKNPAEALSERLLKSLFFPKA